MLLPALGTAYTVIRHVSVVTVDFQATFEDVLVRSVVLNAPTSALLPLFLFLLNTSFLLCMLRVLVVFGLNATLICSLITTNNNINHHSLLDDKAMSVDSFNTYQITGDSKGRYPTQWCGSAAEPGICFGGGQKSGFRHQRGTEPRVGSGAKPPETR